MRLSAARLLFAIAVSIAIAPVLMAGKPGPAPTPPSAMIFGTYGTTYARESFYFLSTNLQTFSKSVSVPADGAWLFGEANFRNFLEFDCDHHYRADMSPGDSTYTPLFNLGMMPAPYDVCSFNNCYSCRVNWGNRKQPEYLTTGVGPAFLDQGARTVTLSTLNGGGDFSSNPDNVNLWIAQVNRVDMSGMRIFQPLAKDDPSPASDTEVADRTFNAETDDRVLIVPVLQHGVDEFPAGPNMNYSIKWDTGTIVTPEVTPPPYPNGLQVLRVPIPKMSTGTHSFTLTAKLPGGKTFTATMSVFVFEKMVYINLDNSFDTANPTDDLLKFVPGSDINGNSVAIKPGVPQIVYVEVLAGGKAGPVTVELQDPSAYPGIAMNYPADSTDVTPDMDFGSGSLSQTQSFPSGKIKHVKFPLYVHDYAANATLHVTLQIGRKTFDLKQTLPRDVDGNHLPEAGWYAGATKIETAGMQPGSDTDSQPAMRLAIPSDAPNGDGDNLTNFEEYRCFVLQGQHQRFNPAVKDFVVDVTAFADDLQFIPAFFPTSAHVADPGEYSSANEINANSDGTVPGCGDSAPNGHHLENVKKVINGGTAPPVFGTIIPRFGDNECYNALGPCTPNNTGDVVVYMNDINARAAADGITDPALIQTLRRNTVVHEAGHTTNLYHVTDLTCIMYGAGFTAQGAWSNIPTTACTNVTATIYDCAPCGPTTSIDNVPNYNETDSLRIKPQF